MSSKIIILYFFLAAFAAVAVHSQFVYTPYVYSSYVPYYGWVWGSNNKNGAGDAPMPPPPSSNGNGGPGPMGPSFTNNAPRL